MDILEDEERSVASGRGKWSETGVPHKGWQCVDIEDLGEPQVQCEMCESQTIRYVHHMEHQGYKDVLEVGCVCAGNMEGNLAAAKHRETTMKSRASKRKRWLSRKWKISAKGNPWLTTDGYRITVYERGNGWAATVGNDQKNKVFHSRRNYKSEELAKLWAFDFITKLLSPKA